MRQKHTIGLGLILVILVVVVAVESQNSEKGESRTSDRRSEFENGKPNSRSRTDSQPNRRAAVNEGGESLFAEWESLSRSLTGGELKSARQNLCRRALGKLEGMELALFIEKISDDAPDDLLRSICSTASMLIATSDPRGAETWLASMDKTSLQEILARGFGLAFGELHIDNSDAIIGSLVTKEAKDRFLVGYGIGLMRKNPTESIGWYLENAREIGGFQKLPELLAVLPQDSNFNSIDDKIPKTEASVAVEARTVLYRRWLSFDPEGAVNYIEKLNDATKFIPGVLKQWAGSSPKEMEIWINNSAPGSLARDWGVKIISERLAVDNPVAAWERIIKIDDASLRSESMKVVKEIWEKKNPGEAQKYWDHYLQIENEEKR